MRLGATQQEAVAGSVLLRRMGAMRVEKSSKTAEGTRRELLHKRVEGLTQPVAEHQIAELDLDTRRGFTMRSGTIVLVAVVFLAVVVGAVMGIRVLAGTDEQNGNGGTGVGGTHALSVPTSETTVVSHPESGAPHERAGKGGEGTGGRSGDRAGDSPDVDGKTEASGERADSGITTSGSGIIVVSVQGMVAHPGLLRVKDDLRVGDVISLAGPTHSRARVDGLNLAQQVADGMQIVIDPRGSRLVLPVGMTGGADGAASGDGAGAHAPSAAAGGTTGSAGAEGNKPGEAGKVNINTADEAALETLSGVGPATAKAIVEWRTTNGKFRSVEQLMEVRGIGPAKFATMKDSVTV